MKTIKIILAVCVLSSIGYFLIKWYTISDGPASVTPPKNTYTEDIQKKIDALKSRPANVFCPIEYRNIQTSINAFYNDNTLGSKSIKVGKIWKNVEDDNNNKIWKDILSKNLYSAYSLKFTEQTNFIFDGKLWRSEDLSFISNELKELKNSPYLNSNNSTANSFNSINAVIIEYEQTNKFIVACYNYDYNNLELENNYPDVSGMLNKSKSFGINGFRNSKLFNCKRLIDGINNIPSVLFTKHVKYLTNKLKMHAPLYKNFKSQAEYIQNIYNTLEDQVEALTNDSYKIDENVYNKNFNDVKNTLLFYNKEAYIYFRNK